ncbi:MAG: MFS transporter [Candidatus Nanopelagicales bacterium]
MALPVTLRAVQARTGVRRVLAAYALYCLVEMTMWIGIILYAFAEGGAVLAGIVAVAQLLPSAVIAPLLTGIAERLPRGRALVLAYLGVTATCAWTLASLAAEADVWLVTVAAGTSVTALAVARPLHYAVLPALAEGPDDLVSSISLSSMAEGLALFAGPILAGVGTQAFGTWSVVAAATVAVSVSTVLVLRLGRASAAPAHHGEEEGPLREAFGGFSALRGDRGAIALMVVLTTFFVFIGALDVLGVAYSEDVLELGHSGSGLLIGAAGIGAFVGAAIAASFVRRRELTPVIMVSGVVLGSGLAAVALFSLLPPAMAMLALGGLAGQLLMVAGRTLLQRSTDDSVIARVFAVQESTSLLGLALGSALAPLLVALISARGAFIPLGLGIVVCALVCAGFIRSLDVRAVYRPAEMELLRSVPFLAVLPPYELERLAKAVTWREVPEGTVVVTEGEPGRDFFIVDEGSLAVQVGDIVAPEPLAAPGWFGEVALLQDVPRTATVTALTPVRLLRIQAADFLAAVTGSPDGRQLASEISAAHLARDAARRSTR